MSWGDGGWPTGAQVAALREVVAAIHSTRASLPDEEVCIEQATVRELVVSDGCGVHAATDRCGGAGRGSLVAVADQIIDTAGARRWIGRPADWKVCPVRRLAPRGAWR